MTERRQGDDGWLTHSSCFFSRPSTKSGRSLPDSMRRTSFALVKAMWLSRSSRAALGAIASSIFVMSGKGLTTCRIVPTLAIRNIVFTQTW